VAQETSAAPGRPAVRGQRLGFLMLLTEAEKAKKPRGRQTFCVKAVIETGL
jgi:hypothetical protein